MEYTNGACRSVEAGGISVDVAWGRVWVTAGGVIVMVEAESVVIIVGAGSVVPGAVVVKNSVVSSIVVQVPGGSEDNEMETAVSVIRAVVVAVAVA